MGRTGPTTVQAADHVCLMLLRHLSSATVFFFCFLVFIVVTLRGRTVCALHFVLTMYIYIYREKTFSALSIISPTLASSYLRRSIPHPPAPLPKQKNRLQGKPVVPHLQPSAAVQGADDKVVYPFSHAAGDNPLHVSRVAPDANSRGHPTLHDLFARCECRMCEILLPVL